MARSQSAKKIKKKSSDEPKVVVDLSRRLYVRMPKVIKDEILIKELHPLIRRVILPRQRARFCFMEFETESDAQTALADLLKKKPARMVIGPAIMKPAGGDTPFKFRIQKTGRKNVKL